MLWPYNYFKYSGQFLQMANWWFFYFSQKTAVCWKFFSSMLRAWYFMGMVPLHFTVLLTKKTNLATSCLLSCISSPLYKGFPSKKERNLLLRWMGLAFFSFFTTKMYVIGTHISTLVLLNPDMSCLCRQCRSRSVGFWRSQLIWICTVCH